jgi:hypothetical protein
MSSAHDPKAERVVMTALSITLLQELLRQRFPKGSSFIGDCTLFITANRVELTNTAGTVIASKPETVARNLVKATK